MNTLRVRIVGTGRAGASLAKALSDCRSVDIVSTLSHGDDVRGAASGVDVLILAVPDAAISQVARQIDVVASTVVVHLSGATTLDALLPHDRRASLHPLVALSEPVSGAAALRGAWMALSGDAVIEELVEALHGKPVRVAETDRVSYHAAAVIASNHLIALLGQVERVAEPIGVPIEAFLDLAAAAVENTRRLGPARALPGPVSRGDWSTVRAHIDALLATERSAYVTMAREAAKLADREWPADIG